MGRALASPFLVSTVRARPLYIYIYRRRTSPPGPRVVPIPVWRLSVHFAITVNHVLFRVEGVGAETEFTRERTGKKGKHFEEKMGEGG